MIRNYTQSDVIIREVITRIMDILIENLQSKEMLVLDKFKHAIILSAFGQHLIDNKCVLSYDKRKKSPYKAFIDEFRTKKYIIPKGMKIPNINIPLENIEIKNEDFNRFFQFVSDNRKEIEKAILG